jgi:hypothetical protein
MILPPDQHNRRSELLRSNKQRTKIVSRVRTKHHKITEANRARRVESVGEGRAQRSYLP